MSCLALTTDGAAAAAPSLVTLRGPEQTVQMTMREFEQWLVLEVARSPCATTSANTKGARTATGVGD